MADIKPLDAIVEKYGRVTPARARDYEYGVRNPVKDWATEASAAEEVWAAATADAARRRAFSRGVTAVGTPGWQTAAIEKGIPRWGPGITVGIPKYRTGFARYHDVIARTILPPRLPTGDPGNIERVRVIAAALFDAKVRGS